MAFGFNLDSNIKVGYIKKEPEVIKTNGFCEMDFILPEGIFALFSGSKRTRWIKGRFFLSFLYNWILINFK